MSEPTTETSRLRSAISMAGLKPWWRMHGGAVGARLADRGPFHRGPAIRLTSGGDLAHASRVLGAARSRV
jgi:hypothetical protein